MRHILMYHMKSLIRNKTLIFWTTLFPIALSTFLAMTVVGYTDGIYELETIPIAIVDEDGAYARDLVFQQVLEEVNQGEEPLFAVTVLHQEAAKEQLLEGTIDGYITYAQGKRTANVSQDGINQTIMISFLNEFQQKSLMVQDLMQKGASQEQVMSMFEQTNAYVNQTQDEEGDLSVIYFYAVLAMSMLYGGYLTLRTNHNQMPNHSEVGKRNAIAKTPHAVIMLADFLLCIALHLIIQTIILIFMSGVLKISFGDQLLPIIIVIIIGSFAGNALGTFISVYGPIKFDAQTGVLSGVTVLLCTLSGMMMVQLKYLVEQYAPWLAAINPANMITDALYAQYYYGMNDRFVTNIVSLLIFTALAYGCSYVRLRRKQYVSL